MMLEEARSLFPLTSELTKLYQEKSIAELDKATWFMDEFVAKDFDAIRVVITAKEENIFIGLTSKRPFIDGFLNLKKWKKEDSFYHEGAVSRYELSAGLIKAFVLRQVSTVLKVQGANRIVFHGHGLGSVFTKFLMLETLPKLPLKKIAIFFGQFPEGCYVATANFKNMCAKEKVTVFDIVDEFDFTSFFAHSLFTPEPERAGFQVEVGDTSFKSLLTNTHSMKHYAKVCHD